MVVKRVQHFGNFVTKTYKILYEYNNKTNIRTNEV